MPIPMSCVLSLAGCSTSRDQIENEVLPAFLGYYQRYEGFGFWAAAEKTTGNSWAGSISGRARTPSRAKSSLVTDCASQPGARGLPPRGRALICKGFAEFGVHRGRGGDAGQNSLAAGDGEGGPEAGADLLSALAVSD